MNKYNRWPLKSALLLLCLSGCSTLPPSANLHWQHNAVFVTESRIQILKDRVLNKVEPTYSAWVDLMGGCERNLNQPAHPVSEWAVAGFYDDPETHMRNKKALSLDATAAYAAALCFRITGDGRFAESARKILNSWRSTLHTVDLAASDSKLSLTYHVPPLIVAAELLRADPIWMKEDDGKFKGFVSDVLLPLNTMRPKLNNHGDWGVFFVLVSAAYLDDRSYFDEGERRYRELIDSVMEPDGTLRREVCRSDTKNWCDGPHKGKNGLWYTNFSLMPKVLSAEVLRLNGYDRFDYRSPIGGTLRKAYEKALGWNEDPSTFPYYGSNGGVIKTQPFYGYIEILNPRWPYEKASLLLRKGRPFPMDLAMPFLTFTHGE